MNMISRRTLLGGAGAATMLTAACGNGIGSRGSSEIDARVDATHNFLYSKYPNTVDLRDKSVGILTMPLVNKVGFGVGGSWGRGALRINDVTVDYYSAASGSIGLQIGAQQYAHSLFFLTNEALEKFRRSLGWEAGADAEYTLMENGENISAATTTSLSPVIALIYGQAGLIAGATLKGTKYTRIIP